MPNTNTHDVFYLPDLGEGLEEAELIEWSIEVGQRVQENDVLAKMETAKALVEVPSPRDGVIAALHGKPGQAIKVGAPLVSYKAEDPAVATEPEPQSAAPAKVPVDPAPEQRDAGTVVGTLGEAPATATNGKPLAAPAVRKLARDLGVEIDHLTGTGIGGRITEQDVRAAAGPSAATVTTSTAPEAAPRRPLATTTPAKSHEGDQRIPFRGVRRTIAEHLRYSVTHAVHFTVMDEADVTDLDVLRRKLVAASNEKISFLPFVASAVCRVLTGQRGALFARLNSTVDDDTQEIVQHAAIHLGIATDTDSGLMVPVIRDAHRMGVLEINRRIAELAQSARDRTLTPAKLSGSTFTISNFGSFAGRFGTPIINYPEAAILAVGRAREGVVARNGMIGVGKLLPLSLSADHRVIDGATAATALAKIIDLLQSPEDLLPAG